MLTKRLPEISVDESKLQVIVHLCLEDLLASREPPNELIAEARLRIAALKSEGLIDDFMVYEADLAEAWRKLLRRKTLTRCDLVVAAGFPRFNGFSIDAIGEGKSRRLAVTVTAPRFVAKHWHPEWIFAYARKRAADLGYRDAINFTQLHFLWARQALNGESALSVPIRLPATKPTSSDKSAPSIQLKASKGWVQLTVASPKACDLSGESMLLLQRRIKKQARKLASGSGGSGYYVFFDRYTSETLKSFAHSPQRFGINLPHTWLCGIRGTDQPYADDLIRGLPLAFPYLLTTVVREMMRLHGASFTTAWLTSKLLQPLNEDVVQGLMNILRARNIITQDDDGKWILAPELKYVGYKVAASRPEPFAIAASKIAVSALEDKSFLYADGHALAISEAQQQDLVSAIHRCRDRVMKIIRGATKNDTVIQINLCLLPLTRQNKSQAQLESSSTIASEEYGSQLGMLAQTFRQLDAFKRDEHWLAAKLIIPVTLPQRKQIQAKSTRPGDEAFDSRFMALLAAELLEINRGTRGECSFVVVACDSAALPLIQEEVVGLKKELIDLARQCKGKDQVYAWSSVILPHTV